MAIADILLSPAVLYHAPVGETLPDENSVDYGEDWGGNWDKIAYTTAPLTMNYSYEEYQVQVEQLTNPVKRIKTSEDLTFETTLAEFISENLVLALGGSATATPAGSGQRAMWEHEMGGETTLDVYTWGFEGKHVDDDGNVFAIRIQIYRGTAVMNAQLQFAKAQEGGIPIQIKAQADTSKDVGKQLMKIQKVTGYAAT